MKNVILSLLVLLSFSTFPVLANTTIDTNNCCAIRDLDVTGQNGEKVKLDLIRTAKDPRGEVFLKINTQDQIGEHIELHINEGKPEVLKITKEKGSFIPLNVITKLRFAKKLRFSISMKKGNPIVGNLSQHHFDWMQKFGKTCA